MKTREQIIAKLDRMRATEPDPDPETTGRSEWSTEPAPAGARLIGTNIPLPPGLPREYK